MKKSKKGITASKLREEGHCILDEITRTSVPVDIERDSHKSKILPEEPVRGRKK